MCLCVRHECRSTDAGICPLLVAVLCVCRYLGLATQLAQFTVRYHRTLARLKQTFPKLPAKLRTPLQTALNDAAHTLHAASLSFPHPRSGAEVSFSAPLPGDMRAALTWLRAERGRS